MQVSVGLGERELSIGDREAWTTGGGRAPSHGVMGCTGCGVGAGRGCADTLRFAQWRAARQTMGRGTRGQAVERPRTDLTVSEIRFSTKKKNN